MKKATLFLFAMLVVGATFACDGDKGKKACCKKGEKKECCHKGKKSCHKGDKAKADKDMDSKNAK